MIKRAVSVSIILFFAYFIFVTFFSKKWTASQHQWQSNVIQAQKYIYNEKKDTITNMIVGSSLSCRLIIDSLPQAYNLSFSGQSIFDGLNILTHVEEGKLPKNIFIETNVVLRGEDKKFTQSLNTILYYPKKVFISLREDRQPLAVLGLRLSIVSRYILSNIKSILTRIFQPYSINQTANLFLNLLLMQVNAYNELPEKSLLDESFKNLKDYLDELESKNVNVVFFEMPVNNQLTDLPKAKLIRQSFYKYFPPTKYLYIPLPDSLRFTTTDGVHLKNDEALEYTSYLKNQMNNCIR